LKIVLNIFATLKIFLENTPGINFIKHFWRYFRADVGENKQNFLNQFYKKKSRPNRREFLAQIGQEILAQISSAKIRRSR